MKKTIALILAFFMMLSLLAGCGQANNDSNAEKSGTEAIESLKTMGDVFALENAEERQAAVYDKYYIYVFDLDDTFYRVITSMPADVSDAVWALDFGTDDAKVKELISPLEIERYENLNESILPQEELDALVGKTGEELRNDGWSIWGWNLESMEFWMNYGAISYKVTFDGKVENYDDFEEEDLNPMTVKSAVYDDLGDATNIEIDGE